MIKERNTRDVLMIKDIFIKGKAKTCKTNINVYDNSWWVFRVWWISRRSDLIRMVRNAYQFFLFLIKETGNRSYKWL